MTAALYALKRRGTMTLSFRQSLARGFSDRNVENKFRRDYRCRRMTLEWEATEAVDLPGDRGSTCHTVTRVANSSTATVPSCSIVYCMRATEKSTFLSLVWLIDWLID